MFDYDYDYDYDWYSLLDKTWAEFYTLEVAACVQCYYGAKLQRLKVRTRPKQHSGYLPLDIVRALDSWVRFLIKFFGQIFGQKLGPKNSGQATTTQKLKFPAEINVNREIGYHILSSIVRTFFQIKFWC